jgi:DNA-binding SARP family transcriptional activator
VRTVTRRAGQVARGLAATLALAAVIAGLPVLLATTGGSPIPHHVPGWHQALAALLHHDDNLSLFLAGVRLFSWLAWAAFTVVTLAEVLAAGRGKPARRLAVLGGLQGLAGRLVTLAALTFSSPAGTMLAASAAPVAAAAVTPGTVHGPALLDAAVHAASTEHRTLVRPGECLWTIARHYLGNGDRWPELFRLNHNRIMPSGRRFTSPGHLEAGFRLLLPGSATGAHGHEAAGGRGRHDGHPATDHVFSGPHKAATPLAEPGSAASGPASGPLGQALPTASIAPAGNAAQPHAAAPHTGSPLSYAAVFAAGALTTGAVTVLGRMRARQRHARRPGRRIRLPADTAVQRAEQRLRAAGAQPPLRPLTLRAALRELAAEVIATGTPLPGIAGLCVTPGLLEVLLTSKPAGPPPAPFTVTPGRAYCWQLALPGQDTGQATARSDTGDLLPGLVTAGLASGGGHLLLDLEPLRVTSCAGPAELAGPVLASIAAELATTQLCGWYDLLLVGFSELDVIDGRATSCPGLDKALDLLDARARDLRTRCSTGPAPGEPADIRVRRIAEPDGWELTLLVSRDPPTDEQMARLLHVTAGGGIAALVAAAPGGRHATPARIQVTADPDQDGGVIALISPLNITVRPQPLTPAGYQALVSLFTAAADPADVDPQFPPYHGHTGPPWLLPDPALDGSAAEDPAGPAAGPEPARELADGEVDASGPTGVADGQRPGPASMLHVSVLGPFAVASSAGHLAGRQAELVLALALHGTVGMTMDRLCYTLGADPDHAAAGDTVRQIIARARTQAGVAGDGHTWVQYTGGRYRLHEDATCDWDSFHTLAGRGMRSGSRDDLAAALAQVHGEPFADCFLWWLEPALIETARALIVDAAEMLSGLDLAAGDPAAAAQAARTGLDADPAAEQLWRALMRAAAGAGNLAGVRSAWTRCLDAIADVAADGRPHPETVRLFRQLTSASDQQPARLR